MAAIVLAVAAFAGLVVWYATERSVRQELLGAAASIDGRKIHELGQSIFTGRFAIVVRAERRGTVGTSSAQSVAPRGMTFVAVRYDLTNTTDNPISTLSLPRVELIAASGARHRPDAAISAAYARQVDGDTQFRRSLGAHETSREAAVFEVNEASDLAGWRLIFSENDREILVSLLPSSPSAQFSAERPEQTRADERARAAAKARDEEARTQEQAREDQARAEQQAREEQARAEKQARSEREQARVKRAQARQQVRLERREARAQARAEERARLRRERREQAAEEERNARSWAEDDGYYGYDDDGGYYDDYQGSPDDYSRDW